MTRGRILILLTVLVAGTLPVPIRALAELGWSAIESAAVRCLIGSLVVGLVHWHKLAQIKHSPGIVFTLGLATVIAMGGYMYALQHIPAGLAAALMFVGPIWVVLWETIQGNTAGREHVACALGFLGTLLIIGTASLQGNIAWTGLAAGLMASLGFALFFMASDRASKKISPECLAFWSWGLAVPAFAWTLPGAHWSMEVVPWVAFIGLVNGALYVLLLFAAVRTIANPSESSIWQYGELVVVSLIGLFLWQEIPTPLGATGALLILVAGILLATSRSAEQTPATT